MSKRLRGLRIVPGLALIALLATACAPGVTHSNGGMDSGVRQTSAGLKSMGRTLAQSRLS